jgi:polyisoprenyl-teichoic acid--peptidoglycan teichoic acid transferase
MRKQDYYEPIIGRESEPRRRPKKKKKRANRGERVVVTLLSLLFLTVAIVATVKYVVRAPEPVTDNEDQQTQQDGTAEDSDAIQTISNGKERKKYCYTILAYGVDNDAGGSDTNMLVRFDAENKKIDVVSLPRDTLMSNGHKLNSSYNNGGRGQCRGLLCVSGFFERARFLHGAV